MSKIYQAIQSKLNKINSSEVNWKSYQRVSTELKNHIHIWFP